MGRLNLKYSVLFVISKNVKANVPGSCHKTYWNSFIYCINFFINEQELQGSCWGNSDIHHYYFSLNTYISNLSRYYFILFVQLIFFMEKFIFIGFDYLKNIFTTILLSFTEDCWHLPLLTSLVFSQYPNHFTNIRVEWNKGTNTKARILTKFEI